MSLLVEVRHVRPSIDLRLQLPEGAITSVVGPSGSGQDLHAARGRGAVGARIGPHQPGRRDVFDSASGIQPAPPRSIHRHGASAVRVVSAPDARENVEAALLHLPRARRAPRAEAALARAHVAGLEPATA